MSRPFSHRLRVRYAECDPQGVVFNAHYLMYFDTAFTELWREAFGSYQAMLDEGVDVVVAEAGVRFLSPARFDDELDVRAQVARLGTTAMTTAFVVVRASVGAPLGEGPRSPRETAGDEVATGSLRHVFVDPRTLSPAPIPERLREGLGRFLAADAAPTAPAPEAS